MVYCFNLALRDVSVVQNVHYVHEGCVWSAAAKLNGYISNMLTIFTPRYTKSAVWLIRNMKTCQTFSLLECSGNHPEVHSLKIQTNRTHHAVKHRNTGRMGAI